ncbi:hypothetical protein MAR_008508 [Mya arenaria]|uniref:Uncharacterized protein n=1 Tax=Mya arenaria TaxID=6604 RepID=A0ABY7DWW0_MYAAR|nr:hypothetical protein MAR_008508 [Mya arenaria]
MNRQFDPPWYLRNIHAQTLLSFCLPQSPTEFDREYIYKCVIVALVTMVGVGTGGSLLLSYLGEFGSSANISAGACISACFDNAERFSKGVQGKYDICSNGFRQFDELVYSKLYNCSTVDDFWDRFIDNPNDVSWSEKLALDYFDSVLEFTNKGHTINYGKCAIRSTI